MTKKNYNVDWDKRFSFEEAFYEIGRILDRKLAGVDNPIIRDLAGMDALLNVRKLLCGKVITSFTPTVGMEEYADNQEALSK